MGGRRGSLPQALVLAVAVALALANRLGPVLRGAGLDGVLGYDDGVYYAGAVALVHGRLPYQDFLFLHPPGVLLALAPVAAVGRVVGETTGWEISRLVWTLMGCLTGALVARTLLPLGLLAAVVGGCAYAVFPAAVLVERTTLGEGLTNVCLALALCLVITQLHRGDGVRTQLRGSAWGVLAAVGAILGFATTVKIWGIVPLLVIAGYIWVVRGARAGATVVLGGGLMIAAVCLPFFLASPATMWRMVVLDQLGRDQDYGFSVRVIQLVTLGRATTGGGYLVLAAGSAAVLVGTAVVAWRQTRYRVVVPVAVGQVALLLVAPIFYPHYVAILAVPAALLIGVTAGVLSWPSRQAWRTGLVVGGCLAVALDLYALSRVRSGEVVPTALQRPVRAATGCLTTDDPNNLLALGVVGRNIERGCPVVVDLGGYSHDLSRGRIILRGRNEAWQQVVVDHLGSGQYALPTRFRRGHGLSAASAREIGAWPVVLRARGYVLRQPPPDG